VATRAGGTGELVRHGVEGFLVELGDHEALARHTGEILAKPELAAALGRAGRERAAEPFGLETMVSRTERLLQGLVAAE
jgi:glycosyltransferase involved in cell wall biosynthesis